MSNMNLLDATKELIAAAATFDARLHAGLTVAQLSAEQSRLYHAVNTAKAAVQQFNSERGRYLNVLSMLICNGCHNRIGWNETPTKYGDWTKCTSCREARAVLKAAGRSES